MTEEENRRKALLYEAMYHEAEHERDIYQRHFDMLTDELMRMPLQSKRVENVVTKYRASLEKIWRGRSGSDAT